MKRLILAFLVGCVAAPTSTTISALALAAVPDDGISDRAAIQAMIDAATAAPDGGTVTLGAGRWTLDRAPVGSYNRFAALSTHGHNLTLRGVGPETVLELIGDQGAQSVALISIDPSAEHVRIADLTLDLSGATNTDEQTHAIATSGVCSGATCLPIRDVKIENVRFRHPRNTTTRKGDCIRLLGNTDATPLIGVRIIGNDFAECARSAIMIQRGVTDLVIAGNTLAATKTCIDGEATGGYDARISITGNVFLPGCSPAISLTNTNGATVTGNTMASNLTIYRSTGVTVAGNAITYASTVDTASIDVANVCDGLAITGNTITRSGASGPVIKLVPHSGGVCGHVAITNNTINQLGTGWGIYGESLSHAVISGNQLTFASAPAYSGIYVRSVMAAAPVVGLVIQGNEIAGPLTYGVQLHASPGTFGAGINVSGNVAPDVVFPLYLNNPGGFAAPVVGSPGG